MTLTSAVAFKDSSLTVWVLSSVTLEKIQTEYASQAYGGVTPIALIVSDGRQSYGIDLKGEPFDLVSLRQAFPDLMNPWLSDIST